MCDRFVDLDLVERKFCQVAGRGISSSKIIEHHDDTKVLKLPYRLKMRLSAFQKGRFGDLQLQPLRRKAGFDQSAQDDVEQIALIKLHGRNVDRYLDMGGPVDSISAGLLKDPFPQRQNQARRFRERRPRDG